MHLPSRRFGRTNIDIPILSLGGMRFQKSWSELDYKDITEDEQKRVQIILNQAQKYGFNHIETARHYGTSELQLGKALKNIDSSHSIIQTKVPPNDNPKLFEEELKKSFERLEVKRIDLLAIHGINTPIHLYQTLKEDGCLNVAKKWQKENLIGHIGFSTHGELSLIENAIRSNLFDYVNLHWYFINQNNLSAIKLARKFDVGVFIISPTDKGGHLHSPSEKLLDLCRPLHPIVFNDLFCLMNQDVHTISVGIANITDFAHHLESVSLLPRANDYVPKIARKLNHELINSIGVDWYYSWNKNLPRWEDTPGEINIPVLMWLSNLLEAWDMEGFVRARYQLLGNGSHWFPGNNANLLDIEVSEKELISVLEKHNHPKLIIDKLRKLKENFSDKNIKRLSKN